MSAECTKKLTFSEQYKHPLWQKRRLERLELVGFGCERCDDHDSDSKSLNDVLEKLAAISRVL